MLKFQISLIAILICCMAVMSCSRSQDALEAVMVDPPAEHLSWMSVTLPVPMGTTAHEAGSRTIYFNEAAAMTNMAEGDKMYPVGSMIVKEAMNADNTEIAQIVSMTKTDDPEYMDYGGWIYGFGGNNLAVADSVGCDECHAKAGEGNDYVFVSLKMDEEMMDGMTGMEEDDMTGMDMEEDDMTGMDMEEDDMTGMEEDDMTGMEEDDMTGMEEDDMTGMEEDDMTGMEEDDMNGMEEDDMNGTNGN